MEVLGGRLFLMSEVPLYPGAAGEPVCVHSLTLNPAPERSGNPAP